LNFILGGKNFQYPGLNGQFNKVLYRLGDGAFVDNVDDFKTLINKVGPAPGPNFDKIFTVSMVNETIDSGIGKGTDEYKIVGGGD
jgi:hypothetical protein